MKKANPQGKGLVPVLQDWHALQPTITAEKAVGQLLADYCVSSLVLSAAFSFRPVPGQDYSLYYGDDGWQLSLITPLEWGQRQPADYVGVCRLRTDMTWQLSLPESVGDNRAVATALARFFDAFIASLDKEGTLEESLPVYLAQLPYYQRMLATGLSTSIRDSARVLGIAREPARQLLSATDQVPLLQQVTTQTE